MLLRCFFRWGFLSGLLFAVGGCAQSEFAALKSLPPPPLRSAYMPVAQQVMPPFGYIGFCVHHARDCEGGSDVPQRLELTTERWEELTRVNAAVNALPEISDEDNYGVSDIWSYPDASGGDCEDMAMEKRHRLIAKGWPSDALLIATAMTADRKGHAVLIAAMTEGDLVLDNLDKSIRLWSDTPYRWLERQSSRRPIVWLSADPAHFASEPQPVYPPLDGPLPITVMKEDAGARVTRVSAFSGETPEHQSPEARK